jgi:hypothetical protein
MKRIIKLSLLIGLAIPVPSFAQSVEEILDLQKDSLYLFSYFTKQDSGLQLGVSANGYDWIALNNGRPIFKPTVGDSLLRDPSIIYDEDEEIFHLVWTTSWRHGTAIKVSAELLKEIVETSL